MSAEPRHPSPWGIASIALVAGLLQIIASVALGMAKLDAFTAASIERPLMYMALAVLVAAAVGSIWLVRERQNIALALGLIWPAGLWFGLRGKLSGLGLAYHGEFILHHFSAVLALALAGIVPLIWARDRRLGPARWLPALFALPGALALGLAHVGKLPGAPAAWALPTLAIVGGALLLMAWPLSVGLFWTRLGPPERRPIAAILLLPVLVRLGFVGAPGIAGELVPDHAIPWLGGAIVVTSVLTLLLLRPRLERWVLVVVGTICLIGSMFFYYLYQHGFGELEDGLSGLLQSLFGFQIPYPSYVDEVRSAALMMGLFFVFVTVYASLVSTEDRTRGIALGLMVIAGLGFSSPHLVLMLGAGALLFVETLLPGAAFRELRGAGGVEGALAGLDGAERPAIEVASMIKLAESLAERLVGLEGAVVAESKHGTAIAVRGSLDEVPIKLVMRISPKEAQFELTAGRVGTQLLFELIPDSGQGGARPEHPISRTHRALGNLRALGELSDHPLDALFGHETSHVVVWEAGVRVVGDPRVGLDRLESLVRASPRFFTERK